MTIMIGRRWDATASASVTMCFVLYTEIASYAANPMRRRSAGRIANEIPRIAVTPAATEIPTASTRYHSGYFARAYVRAAEMTVASRVASGSAHGDPTAVNSR